MTHDEDLGPMPDAHSEPGEPNPGGVDAIDGGDEPGEAGQAGDPDATTPDLPTDKNPAVDDAAPDELSQAEDTSTQATEGEEPASGQEESPA
jgi:hypothetical protein